MMAVLYTRCLLRNYVRVLEHLFKSDSTSWVTIMLGKVGPRAHGQDYWQAKIRDAD